MGLKDLKLPTAQVVIPGNDPIVVRGLSTVEIEVLIREHRNTAVALFDQFKTQAANSENPISTGLEILQMAPELIARAIAMAADEPDAADVVLKLPTSVQLTLAGQVLALTLTVEGDLGKLMGLLMANLGKVSAVLSGLSKSLADKAKSKST